MAARASLLYHARCGSPRVAATRAMSRARGMLLLPARKVLQDERVSLCQSPVGVDPRLPNPEPSLPWSDVSESSRPTAGAFRGAGRALLGGSGRPMSTLTERGSGWREITEVGSLRVPFGL